LEGAKAKTKITEIEFDKADIRNNIIQDPLEGAEPKNEITQMVLSGIESKGVINQIDLEGPLPKGRITPIEFDKVESTSKITQLSFKETHYLTSEKIPRTVGLEGTRSRSQIIKSTPSEVESSKSKITEMRLQGAGKKEAKTGITNIERIGSRPRTRITDMILEGAESNEHITQIQLKGANVKKSDSISRLDFVSSRPRTEITQNPFEEVTKYNRIVQTEMKGAPARDFNIIGNIYTGEPETSFKNLSDNENIYLENN